MKKVLAASWHPGGINAIIPVIKQIEADKKVSLTLIVQEYSEAILQQATIHYKTISDYSLENVSKESMHKLLEKENPDLVLTGTSAQDEKTQDVLEQTTVLAARERDITTISVLDFWGNYSLRFNDIYTDEKFKFLPDKIAIMDVYAEKAMLEEGFDREKLAITGNPHFDNLEKKAKNFTDENKNELRAKIELTTNFLIFYAANSWKKYRQEYGFWDLDNVKMIDEVFQELSEHSVGLVIKLHPRVPEEDLTEIGGYIQEKNNIKLITGVDAPSLVLATDLTLTPNSTVGIEAVYMSKPCISIQPGLITEDFLAVLTKNGLIPVGYTKEDCKSLVKKAILDDDYREKQLIEQASSFRTDGKATERVTNLVYEMLGLH